MIEKVVNKFVDEQIEKNIISRKEREIYKYGYVLFIEVVLNLIIAIMIGILLKEIWFILFFLCMYIPLRSFCGGWHADKLWKCTIISNAIVLIGIYAIKEIACYIPVNSQFICILINVIVIFSISPVGTKNKKLTQGERKKYKTKIAYILGVQLMLTIVVIMLKFQSLLFCIMYMYIVQSIMLLLEKVKYRKDKYTLNC